MNCDYVQEQLSAFLDREESPVNFDAVLSHLYECEGCQAFFGSAVKLRSLAGEDKTLYPLELDESILRTARGKRSTNLLSYRLKLPVYAVSAVAIILLVLSFTFGYMIQDNVHQQELNAILKAPPSQVVYGMPTQVVYPVAMRQAKGDVR